MDNIANTFNLSVKLLQTRDQIILKKHARTILICTKKYYK